MSHVFSSQDLFIRTYVLTPWIQIINWPTWARVSWVQGLFTPGVYNICLRVPRVAYTTSCQMVTAWKWSIRYLSLPRWIATELNLSSERVRNYEFLKELTMLWRQNLVNPRDTPILAFLAQFKTMVDSMKALRYLNIGNYTGHAASSRTLIEDQYNKQTLQRLFRDITINFRMMTSTRLRKTRVLYSKKDG